MLSHRNVGSGANFQDKQWGVASTNMHQNLDDNFALTPARTSVTPMKEQVEIGTHKLQRVVEDVEVPALPEARRLSAIERAIGIQMNKTHLQEVAQKMHQDGQTYKQWALAGRKTLGQLAREKELETLQLKHLLEWTRSPAIIAKTNQLDPEVGKPLPGIPYQVTLAEVLALFEAFGAKNSQQAQ